MFRHPRKEQGRCRKLLNYRLTVDSPNIGDYAVASQKIYISTFAVHMQNASTSGAADHIYRFPAHRAILMGSLLVHWICAFSGSSRHITFKHPTSHVERQVVRATALYYKYRRHRRKA